MNSLCRTWVCIAALVLVQILFLDGSRARDIQAPPMAFLAKHLLHKRNLGQLKGILTRRIHATPSCNNVGSVLKKDYQSVNRINSPEDLKRLPEAQLPLLCKELRECMIENVELVGGHYSSSLGVVELTVALHRVFDSPKDRLIWDIGHQGYIHKMVTGRTDKLHTIRQSGGLSGFLRRYESEHDLFGAGHSSTSIGALQGVYEGDVIKGTEKDRSYVCVIGDGSLTGGMALEALNYSATLNSPLIIIYNDNKQSSLPTGMPAKHGKDPIVPYFMLEGTKKECIDDTRAIDQFERLSHDNIHSPIFIGPIDGHDIKKMSRVLEHLREKLSGSNPEQRRVPVVLHVKTVKGMGCERALKAPDRLHSIKAKSSSNVNVSVKAPKAFTDVLTESLINLGEKDPSVVAITAGMPGSTGVGKFGTQFPDRAFDVGIAEQHAVTFAAGMAVSGAKPFCCLYSTFMQRALDQIIHDVSLQHLPVRFIIDRAGYVGEDGASHHGIYDISYLRMLYNMLIMAPSNGVELQMMLKMAYDTKDRPSAIRYPKGTVATEEELHKYFKYTPEEIADPSSMIMGNKLYEARKLVSGTTGVAVLGFGPIVLDVMKAVEKYKLDVTVADMRFLNPLDSDMINRLLETHHTIVTAEHGVPGGFGSAVLEYLTTVPKKVRTKTITYPKQFAHHGSVKDQNRLAKVDVDGIAEQITALF